MAQDFIRSAAYGLLMAFRFTQSSHHTAELPVVLIPVDAWPDFVRGALRELADYMPPPPLNGDSVVIYNIRFQPATAALLAPTKPLRHDVQGDWVGYAGGEKHTPRPLRVSA